MSMRDEESEEKYQNIIEIQGSIQQVSSFLYYQYCFKKASYLWKQWLFELNPIVTVLTHSISSAYRGNKYTT